MRRLGPGSAKWSQATGGDQEASAAALIDGAPVAIVGANCLGAVVEWNATAERLLGWTRAEVLGRQLATVLEPEDSCSSPLAADVY